MGNKVSPIGLRIGINKDWSSKWYVEPREYAKTLHEDLAIRKRIYQLPEVKGADVAEVEIVRHPQRITVIIHTARPGVLIGVKGANIERIGLEYQKKLRDIPAFAEEYTAIVEFSRGSEHGGYASAFEHLPFEMAQRMAILYIDVSWEESLRKNRKRFNPNKPDSILEHGLPDAKLERLYREVDWQQVSAENPDYITIKGCKVPYVVFNNSDDITTPRGEALGARLEQTLTELWNKANQ